MNLQHKILLLVAGSMSLILIASSYLCARAGECDRARDHSEPGWRDHVEDLPARIRQQQSNETPPLSVDDLEQLFSGLPNLDEIERRYILHVLDATGNNRKTLYRMAARFAIEFAHPYADASAELH